MQQEYKILKVQRISDGEVFSVGDTVGTIYKSPAIKNITIEEIEVNEAAVGGVLLTGKGIYTALSIAKHVES